MPGAPELFEGLPDFRRLLEASHSGDKVTRFEGARKQLDKVFDGTGEGGSDGLKDGLG